MPIYGDAILLLRAGNYSGSGDWLDESGNGRDFSITGATFTAQAGVVGYFTFDGVNDFMTHDDTGNVFNPGSGDFTVVMVVRTSSAGDIPPIDNRNSFTAGVAGWQLRDSSARADARADDDTAEFTDTFVGTMSNSTIYDIAFRVDTTANELEVFQNGVGTGTPVDTSTMGTVTGTDAIDIGRVGASYDDGDVIAIAIWSRALSDADLATAGDELRLPVGGAGMLLLDVG